MSAVPMLRGFVRSLRPSIQALFAQKVRAAFAVACVAAGVAAVLVTSAIGAGVQMEVLHQTEAMGANLLVVRPAQVSSSASRKTIRGVVTTLKIADFEAIARLNQIRKAVPGFETEITVKAAGNAMKAMVLGTTAEYLEVCRFHVSEGRFLNDEDNEGAGRVAVLGARVNDNLFGGADPRGETIRLRGVPFEVIGVLEAKGVQLDGSDEDNLILIPIRTALRRVFNSSWLNPVFVSVRDPQQMDQAENEIGSLLRIRHRLDTEQKPDDFAIQNKSKTLSNQKQLAGSLSLLTTSLAAVSLFVGGTGILALMLMSAKERTGEIGLRMAVGARPFNILLQFLLEATLLSLSGWAAGVVIGAAGAVAIAFGTGWKIATPVDAILASLAMAAITGIGFGWYPARKASLTPPIEALLAE